MKKIVFPHPFRHEHPPLRNPHEEFESRLTFGERMADRVAAVAGSWQFIITQTLVLSAWVFLNVTAWIRHWDPYPFILMNLVLSLQAAYTAPMIMISQKRQSARDRFVANHDYELDRKAETEIRVLLEHQEAQSAALAEILHFLQEREKNESGQRPE